MKNIIRLIERFRPSIITPTIISGKPSSRRKGENERNSVIGVYIVVLKNYIS